MSIIMSPLFPVVHSFPTSDIRSNKKPKTEVSTEQVSIHLFTGPSPVCVSLQEELATLTPLSEEQTAFIKRPKGEHSLTHLCLSRRTQKAFDKLKEPFPDLNENCLKQIYLEHLYNYISFQDIIKKDARFDFQSQTSTNCVYLVYNATSSKSLISRFHFSRNQKTKQLSLTFNFPKSSAEIAAHFYKAYKRSMSPDSFQKGELSLSHESMKIIEDLFSLLKPSLLEAHINFIQYLIDKEKTLQRPLISDEAAIKKEHDLIKAMATVNGVALEALVDICIKMLPYKPSP